MHAQSVMKQLGHKADRRNVNVKSLRDFFMLYDLILTMHSVEAGGPLIATSEKGDVLLFY